MQKTMKKYREHVKKVETSNPKTGVYTQKLNHEAAAINQKEIEQLEASTRRFLGQDIVSSSLDEINELGRKLEHALTTVRARKANLYEEQERCLLEENARLWQEKTSLCQKHVGISPPQYSMKEKDMVDCSENKQFTEVETDLFIGLRLS
ncbi:hypothetical protein M8C21_005280 [Ambrosia artemisiifolia]|uniref:K-box domain-containing protein n=1 Tax=Ambrosia artemisiifolia TaxID=4212 RepID=A0AAD5GG60_AMBAR|nr:hypothetical protein M8C21_005280 [Ambrosia artemisiifolia]